MKNYHWYIILVLSILIGVFIGNNLSISFLKIKTDGIALDQLLTILITLFVGWYIPSKLSKIIEDKRVIRNHLVEEINSFLSFIKKVKLKIHECSSANVITPIDKAEINLIFEEADVLLDNLHKQTEIVNDEVCNEALLAYRHYWRFVTGGSLMNHSYIAIDPTFNSSIIVEHYKLEIVFKRLAQTIQTLD